MTKHSASKEHMIRFAIQRTGELQEIESRNAGSIRGGFYNLYAPTTMNKDKIRLFFDALLQRSHATHVVLEHNVTVFPGDTTGELCAQYGAWMLTITENNLSVEDIACTLQEIPATDSPYKC